MKINFIDLNRTTRDMDPIKHDYTIKDDVVMYKCYCDDYHIYSTNGIKPPTSVEDSVQLLQREIASRKVEIERLELLLEQVKDCKKFMLT